jgi:ABC-2 type transport system ATP-binding protein
MEGPALELDKAQKVYRDLWGRPRVRALDGLTLSVERGEVFGLLGPNGAGKSTTIKLITGLLFPTSGRVRVLGREAGSLEVRAKTGYLPEETRLHRFLTAAETIDLFGRFVGLSASERRSRTGKLLEMVGLEHAASRRVGEFSKGMARRIGLAVALVSDPDLLILDEPTSGLDPIGTREVKDLILELAKRGKTVLLSSHLLADVEDACSRIAVLYGGKLRALGRTEELLEKRGRLRIELDRPADELEVARLAEIARGVARGGPVEVGTPHDRLEAFFLRVVEEARAKDEGGAAGAHVSKGVAAFLTGTERPSTSTIAGRQAEAPRAVLEKLAPSPSPSPGPSPTPSPGPVAGSGATQKVISRLLTRPKDGA